MALVDPGLRPWLEPCPGRVVGARLRPCPRVESEPHSGHTNPATRRGPLLGLPPSRFPGLGIGIHTSALVLPVYLPLDRVVLDVLPDPSEFLLVADHVFVVVALPQSVRWALPTTIGDSLSASRGSERLEPSDEVW